jgi:tetrahydromethanopterin S-methyltransferase subunit F
MSDEETPLDQRVYGKIRTFVFGLTILGFICALIFIGILVLM